MRCITFVCKTFRNSSSWFRIESAKNPMNGEDVYHVVKDVCGMASKELRCKFFCVRVLFKSFAIILYPFFYLHLQRTFRHELRGVCKRIFFFFFIYTLFSLYRGFHCIAVQSRKQHFRFFCDISATQSKQTAD